MKVGMELSKHRKIIHAIEPHCMHGGKSLSWFAPVGNQFAVDHCPALHWLPTGPWQHRHAAAWPGQLPEKLLRLPWRPGPAGFAAWTAMPAFLCPPATPSTNSVPNRADVEVAVQVRSWSYIDLPPGTAGLMLWTKPVPAAAIRVVPDFFIVVQSAEPPPVWPLARLQATNILEFCVAVRSWKEPAQRQKGT